MKKFHTLPGVIPRVGVAEGRGAFARWSFTAGAALLLLLSAEGARGAGVPPSPSTTPTVAELNKRVNEFNTEIERLKKRQREIQTIQETKFYGRNDPEPKKLGDELTDIEDQLNKNNSELKEAIAARDALTEATTPGPQTPTLSPTNPGNQSDSGLGGREQVNGLFNATINQQRDPNSPLTVKRPSQISDGSGGTAPSSSGTTKAANGASTNTSNTTAAAASGTTSATTTTNTAGGNSTSAYTSNRDWETNYSRNREAKQKEANADPCYVSSELGESQGGIYKCAGTNRTLQSAQQITAGAVVAGTVGMAMKNQNAVNQALQSGSQSGNLDAQASIQSGQEDISKTVGVIQMTQALMLKSKADSHGKNIRQLEGNLVKSDAMQSKESMVLRNDHSNDDATAALEKFVQKGTSNGVSITGTTVPGSPAQDLGVGYLRKSETPDAGSDAAGQEVAKDLNAAVKFVGQAAVAEQKNIQDKANEEAKSMFQQAAIAFTVAEQARKNKETLRTAAQNVKQVEKSTKDLAFQFAPNDRSPNQLAAPNQSLSLSSAQDASQSKTDGLGQNGTDEPGETPNFDAPFGAPNDPIPQPSPQPVGEFQRNPNGGGGGGGGAGGGTSTQPSSNDDDHGGGGGSTYAKLPTTNDKYSAGGGGVGGSGGGGGNAGMDFTGMLSQFLPKPEDQGPKNGILDFGARAPAQTALPSSLLDASANLFERVHEAYQSKNRKGQVGQAVSGGKNP